MKKLIKLIVFLLIFNIMGCSAIKDLVEDKLIKPGKDVVEEVKEEVEEKVVTESVKEIVKETQEEVKEEAVEKIVEETKVELKEIIVTESIKQVVETTKEEVVTESIKQVVETTKEEVVTESVKQVVEEVTEQIIEQINITENVIENISEEIVENIEEEIINITTHIQGTVLLSGSFDHSGVSVYIGKQAYTTQSISSNNVFQHVATTNIDGSFNFHINSNQGTLKTTSISEHVNLPTGYYSLKFSKEEYVDKIISNVPIAIGNGFYTVSTTLKEQRPEFYTLTPTSNTWIDTKIDANLGDIISVVSNGEFICPNPPSGKGPHQTTVFGYGWDGYFPQPPKTIADTLGSLVFKVNDQLISPYGNLNQQNSTLVQGTIIMPKSGRLYMKINDCQGIYVTGKLIIQFIKN